HRVEVEREGAIAERALELEAHQVVARKPDVLLCDRGAQDVFAERFASHRVVGSGGGGGVQRKAVRGSAESLGIREVAARARAEGVVLVAYGTGGGAGEGGG